MKTIIIYVAKTQTHKCSTVWIIVSPRPYVLHFLSVAGGELGQSHLDHIEVSRRDKFLIMKTTSLPLTNESFALSSDCDDVISHNNCMSNILIRV